jgi:ASC-1-like (ASCH) protein
MEHVMSLFQRPFDLIKDGTKVIEVRRNDEKRQAVRVGDRITFALLPAKLENITVKVLGKYPFGTFEELYKQFDYSLFGCAGYTLDEMISGTFRTYTREQEQKYGVLGIRNEYIRT